MSIIVQDFSFFFFFLEKDKGNGLILKTYFSDTTDFTKILFEENFLLLNETLGSFPSLIIFCVHKFLFHLSESVF